MFRLIMAVTLACGLSPAALADSPGQFCNDAGLTLVLCQMEAKLVAVGGKLDKPECDAAASGIKARFNSLRKTKSGEPLELLKDYYAKFLTAVSLRGARTTETMNQYDQRIAAADATLVESCNRLKIEE